MKDICVCVLSWWIWMPTDRESGISCLGTVSHSMRLPASSNSVPWPCSEFLQPSCQVKKGVTHAGLHGWHATQLAQKPVPSSGRPWGSFCLMKSTPCLGFADCFLSSQMLSEWTAPPYWVKQIFTFAPLTFASIFYYSSPLVTSWKCPFHSISSYQVA